MKLQIIVGSTRPGRQTQKLAQWVANEAKKLEKTETEIVDLQDYDLPLFNEAISPQYNPERKPIPVVKKWLEKLEQAEAYVLVTPEYNRSTSGVLKNALDYLDFQFKNKPVALVAHGSTGGAQAISHLRGIVPGLQAITIPSAVYFAHRVGDAIDENGDLGAELAANPHGPQSALKTALEHLQWYSDALAAART